jgi:hypothetical protein
MRIIEAIEYLISTTDGCFGGGATLDVSDCLNRVADLNLIKYDEANTDNIKFIFEEAFPFLRYDIEFIKFAHAVAENASKWIKENEK